MAARAEGRAAPERHRGRGLGRAAGRRRSCLAAALLLGSAAAACASRPEAAPAEATARFAPPPPRGLALHLPAPADNRPTPRRAALGRLLFFDPVVSRDSTVACASCHRPELGFADTLARSPGVDGRTGRRATPTLVNRGYGRDFFWDGRGATLEEAVLLPIEDPAELDLALKELVSRLARSPRYAERFRRAYGEPPSRRTVGAALATFVRLVRAGDAPLDRHLAGGDDALSAEARRGRRLFLGKAGCAACHAGPGLTDEAFHNTGVSARSAAAGRPYDPGRSAVTGRREDRGRFKTPTLRQVGARAPYMHDGSLADLEAVVRFYDAGGHPDPGLDPEIRPLGLTEAEAADLLAFLRSLDGRVEAPGPDGRPRPAPRAAGESAPDARPPTPPAGAASAGPETARSRGPW